MSDILTRGDQFRARVQEVEPFIGHPLKPLPMRKNPARTEKVATYMELDLLKFVEEYSARAGFRSTSEAIRRLCIIGAQAEGYAFKDMEPELEVETSDEN